MLPLLLVLLHVTLQQLYTNTSFAEASSNGTVLFTASCFSGTTGLAPTIPYHWTQFQPNGSILIGYGFTYDPNYSLQVPIKEKCRATTHWSICRSIDEQTFVPICSLP